MLLLNGVKVDVTKFPDGTSQVWKLPPGTAGRRNEVVWVFEDEGEFLHLAQLCDLIRVLEQGSVDLMLPYLPYARQDKPISNDHTFALQTFGFLLNCLTLRSVSAFDPHSQAAERFIDNFKALSPADAIKRALEECRADLVCYPDEGALTRYDPILPRTPTTFAVKTRDQATGKIVDYQVHAEPKDQSVLVVDDICDGGATFILLSNTLYQKGAKAVHLYVSHGIFSKGLAVLRDAGIQRIFTKDGEVK